MNTQTEVHTKGTDPIVYIRRVNVADLPEDMQLKATGIEQLYAVHDAEGSRIALVGDRKLAFMLARQHDMTPVSAH